MECVVKLRLTAHCNPMTYVTSFYSIKHPPQSNSSKPINLQSKILFVSVTGRQRLCIESVAIIFREKRHRNDAIARLNRIINWTDTVAVGAHCYGHIKSADIFRRCTNVVPYAICNYSHLMAKSTKFEYKVYRGKRHYCRQSYAHRIYG